MHNFRDEKKRFTAACNLQVIRCLILLAVCLSQSFRLIAMESAAAEEEPPIMRADVNTRVWALVRIAEMYYFGNGCDRSEMKMFESLKEACEMVVKHTVADGDEIFFFAELFEAFVSSEFHKLPIEGRPNWHSPRRDELLARAVSRAFRKALNLIEALELEIPEPVVNNDDFEDDIINPNVHHDATQVLADRLFRAVCEDDTVQIRELLEAGADPLHHSVHLPAVEVPVNDENVNSRTLLDFKGYTLLSSRLGLPQASLHERALLGAVIIPWALTARSMRAFRMIISHCAVNETRRAYKSDWFHLALCLGWNDVVKVLVNNGADCNAIALDEFTPLGRAAFYGHSRIVDFLLSHGASIDNSQAYGFTLLHSAVRTLPRELIAVLIDRGIALEERDDEGFTPLHYACEREREDIVELLLNRGADCRIKINNEESRYNGYTPFHTAANNGSEGIVRLLLASGADPRVGDANGNTPLHRAAMQEYKAILEILVAAGVDINARNIDGETALYSVAADGSIEIVRFLVEQGADVTIATHSGSRPIDIVKPNDTERRNILNIP